MTMPPLPANGATNWRDTWAQAVHNAATEVTSGRLTAANVGAASVAAVQDAITAGDIEVGSAAVPRPEDFAYLRGVNTQGLGGSQENAANVPGVVEVDYHLNSQAFYNYIASRGHKIVRIDFLWERVQAAFGGPLRETGLNELKTAVQRAANAGLLVLLDMKNYGRYWLPNDTQVMFGAGITAANFADVWAKLAQSFADQPAVAAYGLMNEPHDLPTYPSSYVAGSTLHTFDSTDEGWTLNSDGTSNTVTVGTFTGMTGAGALRFSSTLTAGDGKVMHTYGPGSFNGTSIPAGAVIEFSVYVPSSTPGTWKVRPEIQDLTFTLHTDASYRTITKGQVVKIQYEVPAAYDGTDHRAVALEWTVDGATTTPSVFYVDTVTIGTAGATTTYWKEASQAAVTAIRATGDERAIFVAGDHWSGAGWFDSNNGNPWITDPADNIVYEAHYYMDPDTTGTYNDVTYAATEANAVTQGYANLAARVASEIGVFINWLDTHGQRGFIGEFGWPNTESAAQWNAAAQVVFDACNAAGVGITYWGTGEWLADSSQPGNWYNQDAYHRDTQSPQAQATIIEAPANLSRRTTFRAATLSAVTGAVAQPDSDLRAELDGIYAATGSSGGVQHQIFTAGGTWTKPAGAVTVTVAAVGAGGGGGGGRQGAAGTARTGGAGGGAGAYSLATFPAAVVGDTVTVTVGTGGTGGNGAAAVDTNGSAGGAGGFSAFGSLLRAQNGQAGQGGSAATSNSNGSGSGLIAGSGSGASSATANGGNGSNGAGATGGGGGGGISTANAVFSGGTGGQCTQTNAGGGTSGAGSTTVAGAAGGAGASHALWGTGGGGGGSSTAAAAGAGGAAGTYGAGGGGGGASANGFAAGSGGAGAPGLVVVTTTF